MAKPYKPFYCHYCKKEAPLVTGKVIYPHRKDLYHRSFYYCKPCNAYVGCHPGTTQPLGILAKEHLRMLKNFVHKKLDVRWKSGKMSRGEVYKQLSTWMGIPRHECHVGWFNEDRCRLALKVLDEHAER